MKSDLNATSPFSPPLMLNTQLLALPTCYYASSTPSHGFVAACNHHLPLSPSSPESSSPADPGCQCLDPNQPSLAVLTRFRRQKRQYPRNNTHLALVPGWKRFKPFYAAQVGFCRMANRQSAARCVYASKLLLMHCQFALKQSNVYKTTLFPFDLPSCALFSSTLPLACIGLVCLRNCLLLCSKILDGCDLISICIP